MKLENISKILIFSLMFFQHGKNFKKLLKVILAYKGLTS